MTRTSVEVPDLTGRTALITGASDGVGLEIARGQASAGAHVIMPVRNRDKGERAIELIRQTVPAAALTLRDLDLAQVLQALNHHRALKADLDSACSIMIAEVVSREVDASRCARRLPVVPDHLLPASPRRS